jgi:hypothetical protein
MIIKSLVRPLLSRLTFLQSTRLWYHFVTPSFKGKTECIDHVCARIKLHTRLDIVNTNISATRIKSYYKPET